MFHSTQLTTVHQNRPYCKAMPNYDHNSINLQSQMSQEH